MKTFGPVPSRRLGRSLGINNIPPKVCTYSCVYCQVGRTMKMQIDRQTFYKPEEILQEVKEKIAKLLQFGETVDYLSFVPDGEPTLDINLGKEINLFRSLSIKTAVITNSSLVWLPDVQADLQNADWISLKIDSVDDEIWHKINRPHRMLNLEQILKGMLEFSKTYRGTLVTETMLVKGLNDSEDNLKGITKFLTQLKPDIAYLAIPIRPPAEVQVEIPSEKTIIQSYKILNEKISNVEYLIGYEGNAFIFSGNTEEDLLSITAVHPMREDGVQEFLAKANKGWETIEKLIQENKLSEVTFNHKKFYMRKFSKPKKN